MTSALPSADVCLKTALRECPNHPFAVHRPQLYPGQKLGAYLILAPIGAGGMGEIYRARDTRLGRNVAIKVLPRATQYAPATVFRFEREAQVLARLNHPGIASIYGQEEGALVMELVEGPTLAERIQRGPLPLGEALHIARQIADALEYVHEKGIVHRDLKPANIKLTPNGGVKLLDFGLAKIENEPVEPVGTPDESLTQSMSLTRAGVILGTSAYMAPEQVRGRTFDKRADIWAFGVVLYEMLTGARLFAGETVSDTLAAVLTKDPALEQVPHAVRKLIERCLRKDPKQRLRDIGDVRLLLEDAAGTRPARLYSWLRWTLSALSVR